MRVKATLLSTWESARTSYWFVPSLMTMGAILLSFATLAVDRLVQDQWARDVAWLYTGSADGARSVLTTIAGSMIGIAGVVFSIAIVALVLASNQFGPRLLRNFMRDLGNQIVLGTFIAAFLYCLLILRKVHSGEDGSFEAFVPQVGLIVAVLWALAGVGVLIYFIHHIALSIQAPVAIAAVGRELHRAIQAHYPQRIGERPRKTAHEGPEAKQQIPDHFEQDSVLVTAGSGGYIHRIEADDLMKEATDHDLVLRIERDPGRFLEKGTPVLRAWPVSRVDEAVRRRLYQTFTIRTQRSLTQDPEFAVEQLVEIAVRALSPGINDPFSAMLCVDRLGEAMGHLAQQQTPSPYRVDGAGRLRVIAPVLGFCQFLDAAFNEVRQYSRGALSVMIRMLQVFERLAHHLEPEREAERRCLAEHAQMVYDQALDAAQAERDRRTLEACNADVQRALEQASSK